jgi:hypothetical protein
MSEDRPKITDGRAQIAAANDRPKLFLLVADTPPAIAIAPKTKSDTPTIINRVDEAGEAGPTTKKPE